MHKIPNHYGHTNTIIIESYLAFNLKVGSGFLLYVFCVSQYKEDVHFHVSRAMFEGHVGQGILL